MHYFLNIICFFIITRIYFSGIEAIEPTNVERSIVIFKRFLKIKMFSMIILKNSVIYTFYPYVLLA